MKTQISILLLILFVGGCSSTVSGPPSVRETSSARPLLADRIDFVEQYVTVIHEYEEVDYDIFYQNNSDGFVPGPSDWDIQIVAKVPPDTLQEWIPQDVPQTKSPRNLWHERIATDIDVSNLNEWYEDGGRSIGIDRENSVVVYRISTMGM